VITETLRGLRPFLRRLRGAYFGPQTHSYVSDSAFFLLGRKLYLLTLYVDVKEPAGRCGRRWRDEGASFEGINPLLLGASSLALQFERPRLSKGLVKFRSCSFFLPALEKRFNLLLT